MKTYIINLKRSPERKVYMQNILKDFPSLDFEFIAAVDGKAMSTKEQESLFDTKTFRKRYSVEVRPGEIGCTLSHQKCYRKIVNDNEPYVLILEDDIMPPADIAPILKDVEEKMKTETPQIILLSGWYWFYKTSPLSGEYKLAHVYDAFLTHAYVINQAAARLLIEERPCITADDWRYIRRKGVRLQAVCPHLIDQNWNGNLGTSIGIVQSKKLNLKWYLKNFSRLIYLKLLKFIGNYESHLQKHP